MRKSLFEMTGISLALCLLGAPVSAQNAECSADTDCGEGERCEQGIVLVSCEVPPCEGEGDGPPGRCVNDMLGEACVEDADCGEDLNCARLLVAIDCPADDPDCAPETPEEDGFCADNATLAASSGLAPEASQTGAPVAAASGGPEGDGAAGGSAPGIAESGAASDTPEDNDASSSAGDSSSCSAGGQTGGLNGLLPMLLALVAVGMRRRGGPGLV